MELYVSFRFSWKFRHIPEELRKISAYSVKFRYITWYSGIYRDVLAFGVFTAPQQISK